jgi:hypothetical protein
MKKTQNKGKNSFNIFKKVTSLHIKTTTRCIRKWKKTFFVTSPKLKSSIKVFLKKNQKSPFTHFRFGRLESPMKGLISKHFIDRKCLLNESFILVFGSHIISAKPRQWLHFSARPSSIPVKLGIMRVFSKKQITIF